MKLPKEQSLYILSDNVAAITGPTHLPREADFIRNLRELSRSIRGANVNNSSTSTSRFSLITKDLPCRSNHSVPQSFKIEISDDAYHHFMLHGRRYMSSWEDDMQLYLGYNPISDEYLWPPIEHIYDNSGKNNQRYKSLNA